MKSFFHYCSLLFIVTVLSYSCQAVYGQDTIKTQSSSVLETAEIKWMSQWPSSKGETKIGFKSWINNFVFGKKAASLSKPISLLVADQDIMYILDQGNNAVFKVSKKPKESLHIIKKKNIDFTSLVGICAFRKNEFLFTDSYLNKILIYNEENKDCTFLNDSLVLSQPTGIAYSSLTNEIWVVETNEHRISILNEKGELIRRIGKRGTESGEFNYPTYIWIDNSGNVYIIDSMNFRVQVFDKDGKVLSVFGKLGDGSGSMARPKGIATDSYGNIYIVDALFNVVQIFDINGNFLYKFGSQGQGEGQFWMPSGIYIDSENNIYIADSYNSRIQVFQLTNCVKK